MRGFNYKKAVQALNWLAVKSGGNMNKMKAIKLIWLADRLHLRRFGRSITGDEYYALPKGPVPSGTRDVLEGSDFLGDTASDYASAYISVSAIDRYTFASLSDPNLKVFSDTDKDTLALIYSKFGQLDHFALSDLSHHFPEWKKHESALARGISSRFPIDQLDFFLNIEEESGLFIDKEENLSITRQMFDEHSNILSLLQ